MRFIQLADTHLDSGAMQDELRSAFARACSLAIDRKADVVLIPGDVFDYETADRDTTSFVARTLEAIAPIPVFIAPGNHDSLMPRSPYFEKWPDNVTIFTSSEFETVTLNDLGCSITGIAHAHRGITERLSSIGTRADRSLHSILLFHGSRDGFRPSEKETVIPFSDAELIEQGFTYAAIGHYHSLGKITDPDGLIRGAYSGCAQGRGLDEVGGKCVLVGEIDREGRVALEEVEVAERRIVRVDVSISGSRSQDEIFARIDDAVGNTARPQDVVYVFAKGVLASGLEIDPSTWESGQPFFAATLNTSAIEPDYDLDAIARESAAASLRSTFVRKMLERQDAASAEDERSALRDAIYYGLSAFDGRKLEPRDAN